MSNSYEYQISVSNIFTAESPEDAILQMIGCLLDRAYTLGYRYDNLDTGSCGFMDAEVIGDMNNSGWSPSPVGDRQQQAMDAEAEEESKQKDIVLADWRHQAAIKGRREKS